MPVGEQQRAKSQFITFTAFKKMNTRLSREALPENEAAWIENLQIIGDNNLVPVPAALAALAALTGGRTASEMFFANITNVDYIIVFTTSGAGIAVNMTGGVQTLFAPDGTFSTTPDMTPYASARILIADSISGYATWDGTAFVKQGGVSPNIKVTAGGTYASTPGVTITGGSGSGATAHAVMGGSGASQFVASVVLDTPGTGYKAGDVLTVTFAPAGATATAIVWPVIPCTTIAVFSGRVWLGNGRNMQWTGTQGFDDTNPANAAGTTMFSDADLSHSITALRTLNNYLFIFGDQSVRQIGSITISGGSITLFTPLVLSSDIGTTFPLTIQSYNRLVLFANKNGVYAIFGASVEKISDDMDGIFGGGSTFGTIHSNIDFTQPLCAAVQDLRNIHCYMLLVRYVDPIKGPRSLILVFQEQKWIVASQGNSLKSIVGTFAAQFQQWDSFGSSGNDVTQLLQDPNTPVPVQLITSLTPHGNPVQAKTPLNAGVGIVSNASWMLTLLLESENFNRSYQLSVGAQVTWINGTGGVVTWRNAALATVFFIGVGYTMPYTGVDGMGKFLGMTISATLANVVFNMCAIEYQEGKLWGNPQLQ